MKKPKKRDESPEVNEKIFKSFFKQNLEFEFKFFINFIFYKFFLRNWDFLIELNLHLAVYQDQMKRKNDIMF